MKTLISLLAITMFIIGTDGFIKCFNKMVGEVNKVKNTVGKKNSENINCIGIFKIEYFSDDNLFIKSLYTITLNFFFVTYSLFFVVISR